MMNNWYLRGSRECSAVCAGHDPAILYDPQKNCFHELKGQGLPLGVVEEADYHECECQIADGQIIVITTDGICEAANKDGEMFGKDRLRNIIRLNADKGARFIVTTVLDALEQFIDPVPQKDDATLVVIKVNP